MTLLLAAIGCGGDDETRPDPTPEPTGDTGPTTVDTGTRPSATLVIGPAEAVSLDPTLTTTTHPVRERWDVLVNWSALTTDAWGASLVPSDADQLLLIEAAVPADQVMEAIASDTLGTSWLSTWQLDTAGRSFARLSELTSGSTSFVPADYLRESATRSWVLGLGRSDGVTLDLDVAVVVTPIANDPNTNLVLVDGEATFSTAVVPGAPVVTWSGWTEWSADWSALTENSLGQPFDDRASDELVVSRFPAGTDPLAAVRDLSAVADATWTLDVRAERDASLLRTRDELGSAFPGFTAGPVWTVSGRCSSCGTPYPSWLVVVEVR